MRPLTSCGAAASTTANRHDAEVRRLRARVEELERDLAAVRRTERVERGSGALRARLLLDTLLDTAQGLRRELALPAVEGSPADAVEAHVAEQGSRSRSGHGSLASDDPAMLEQLLALPRAHMIVDGYNVTKTGWPELSLERQRDRLLAGLAPLVARSGAEVTVVFDAADSRERPVVNRPRGVRVLYSPAGRDRRRRDPGAGSRRAAGSTPGRRLQRQRGSRGRGASGCPGDGRRFPDPVGRPRLNFARTLGSGRKSVGGV